MKNRYLESRPSGMRGLRISQPWAWAVCAGEKDVENRSWSTTYRGPLAILSCNTPTIPRRLARESGGALRADQMPCGVILGVVDLVDIRPLDKSLETNDWAVGPQCWQFAKARLLHEPIAYHDVTRLFELPEGFEQEIEVDLARRSPRPPLWAEAWLAAARIAAFDLWRHRLASYGRLADLEGIQRATSELTKLRSKGAQGHRGRADGRAPAARRQRTG